MNGKEQKAIVPCAQGYENTVTTAVHYQRTIPSRVNYWTIGSLSNVYQFCSVVVITFALHAKGLGFDPQWKHAFIHFFSRKKLVTFQMRSIGCLRRIRFVQKRCYSKLEQHLFENFKDHHFCQFKGGDGGKKPV